MKKTTKTAAAVKFDHTPKADDTLAPDPVQLVGGTDVDAVAAKLAHRDAMHAARVALRKATPVGRRLSKRFSAMARALDKLAVKFDVNAGWMGESARRAVDALSILATEASDLPPDFKLSSAGGGASSKLTIGRSVQIKAKYADDYAFALGGTGAVLTIVDISKKKNRLVVKTDGGITLVVPRGHVAL